MFYVRLTLPGVTMCVNRFDLVAETWYSFGWIVFPRCLIGFREIGVVYLAKRTHSIVLTIVNAYVLAYVCTYRVITMRTDNWYAEHIAGCSGCEVRGCVWLQKAINSRRMARYGAYLSSGLPSQGRPITIRNPSSSVRSLACDIHRLQLE